MLRVRDRIDREHAEPLDLATLAADVAMSPDHLVRTFRRVFGETPHRYLQRRRLERAMALLRTTDLSVTDICVAVGHESLGAFSQLFTEVVGCSPTAYRAQGRTLPTTAVPGPFLMAWTRPSTHTNPSISRKRPTGSAS